MKQSNKESRNSKGGKQRRTLSRRRFIRDMSTGAAGIALASTFPGLVRSHTHGPKNSTVVIARHPDSVIGSTPRYATFDQSIVGELVNLAITEFTGQEAPGLAWRGIFPPQLSSSSVIGIKVNCINSYNCTTQPEMAYAVAEGLASMQVGGGNFPRNNIIIWDRTDSELTSNGGYSLYDDSDPDTVRCYGTNHSDVGYDYTRQFTVQGKTVTPSSILTEECSYLVNLAVLKDHSFADLTLCMKNHLGSITPPSNCHDIDPDVPELNSIIRSHTEWGGKEMITIVDGLIGCLNSGPTNPPDFIYGGIILGTDVVAVDYVGRDILDANGSNRAMNATYVETADTVYGLGTSNPANIDLVEHNPISPATREHVDNMIRFHKEGLATALQVEWAVNRYARGK